MLHFIEEHQFCCELRQIEGDIRLIDDLLQLIQGAVRQSSSTLEVYACVEVRYRRNPIIVHYCKTGEWVTLLSARTGGMMKAR